MWKGGSVPWKIAPHAASMASSTRCCWSQLNGGGGGGGGDVDGDDDVVVMVTSTSTSTMYYAYYCQRTGTSSLWRPFRKPGPNLEIRI